MVPGISNDCHYIAKIGLEFAILLLLLPENWDFQHLSSSSNLILIVLKVGKSKIVVPSSDKALMLCHNRAKGHENM